ncbi:MAG: archaeal proteasome endopeptidase complex subunit beta [Sulfolobaceae archaeon]|nr:archaeal proteasome endopeptidase complex subunit beta [Sulfolobaceae archaeon]
MNQNIDISKHILKGTTTVGLVVKDGVVLAGDRRASAGFFVANKNVRKVLYITDTIGITTAGSVADLQFIYDYLKNIYNYNKIVGRPTTVRALATYLANILSFSKYFPYIVQILIGGYDEEGARLYNLDYLGDMTEEKYTATGSGSPVALGVLEDEYKENMTLDEAVDLAKRAVFAAIRRDSYTGTGVIVAKITKTGHEEYEFYIKKQ